jgi:L-alanine-DL-glutamate epimerase-like enolase superfamily enzyme
MKIARVDSCILHLPLPNKSISDSMHSITHWGVVAARIEMDNGVVGWGFTGTHAHLPSDRLIAACIADVYGPLLIGREAREHRQLWRDIDRFSPVQWVGRAGIAKLAHAAIDSALWDALAKAAGVPLWSLLGGAPRSIPAYNTDVGWLSIPDDALVAGARRAVDAGFVGVKIKVGSDDIRHDARRVAAVRDAIGAGPMLAIDGNGRWDLPTCQRFCRLVEPLDIFWFEEPLWYDDVTSHVRLAEQTTIPVALGEQLYSLDAFRAFVESGGVHWLQPDTTRVGGVTEFLQVADLGLAFRLPVAAHAGDMGQIHQHLTIAHPALTIMEYIPWIAEHFEDPARVRDGHFVCPERPGASTTPTEAALRRFRVS